MCLPAVPLHCKPCGLRGVSYRPHSPPGRMQLRGSWRSATRSRGAPLRRCPAACTGAPPAAAATAAASRVTRRWIASAAATRATPRWTASARATRPWMRRLGTRRWTHQPGPRGRTLPWIASWCASTQLGRITREQRSCTTRVSCASTGSCIAVCLQAISSGICSNNMIVPRQHFRAWSCAAQDETGPIAVPPKPNFQRARRSSSFNVARFRQCADCKAHPGPKLRRLISRYAD